jgi:hypothetical protein
MSRLPLAAAMLALAPLFTASSAGAQGTQPLPIELGIDGGVAISLDDPNTTAVSLPVQQFRVGFFVSPRVSLEPAVSFNYVNIEDFGSATDLSLDLGLLLHLSPDRTRSQMYLRPFAGINRVSAEADDELGGGDDSATQLSAGGGLGVKMPFAGGRLAGRLEAVFAHGFENDDFASRNQAGLAVGLSFLTR